jgi:hypothetical protein
VSYSQPKQNCPYCDSVCEADFVDVGVGMMQCGPYCCHNCMASSIGGFDSPRNLSEIEQKTGWYAPGQPVSDKANTVDGIPVSHAYAKELYRLGLLDIKAGKE